MCFAKHYTLRNSAVRWRHNNGKSVVEIFENVKNWPQASWQMVHAVTNQIVIQS